jgi:AcrR family transcriptional regulator
MTFDEFRNFVNVSMEEVCRDFIRKNGDKISVKKQKTAVKNLLKIFEATLKIGNRKGFKAMSVRDLSRETGLSMGVLYSCFSSKDDLLGIIRINSPIIIRIMTESIVEIADPHEKLHKAIQTHLYLSEVMRDSFFFAYMEAKHLSKDEQKKFIEMELFTEKLFRDILEEGCRAGRFAPVNLELTAPAIKALLQDWYLKAWKFQRRQITIETYASFIMDVVDAYLMRPTTSPV